jgi:hypothetical protein
MSRAVDEVLLRKRDEVAGGELVSTLHRTGGREGPALHKISAQNYGRLFLGTAHKSRNKCNIDLMATERSSYRTALALILDASHGSSL